MSNSIRTLTEEETKQVGGGALPVLAALASFAGHASVRSVGKYLLTRASTTYGVYEAAKFADNQ